MRLLESHGISTDLYQAIVRMHQTLIFFLLKLSFHRLGCCSIKSSAPRKIFYPFFHPNHPCQDENPHHRRLQRRPTPPPEDRHRRQKTPHRHRRRSTPPTPRRPTPPPEDIIDDTEEIDATESEKNEDTRRTITIILGMPRVFCIKHYPPHPTPKQAKAKAKANSKQFFFHKQTPTKELLFFFNSFSIFFSILFQNKGVTTGPLKFLCTQLHKNTLYPSTPFVIFVNIGSFPKSRLSQSKTFPFHPFKANQIKYSSTSCCRKLLSLFFLSSEA